MWNSPSVRACMCRHLFVWDLRIHWHHFDCYGSFHVDTLVLRSNSLCHPEDAVNHWEAKGLFHLCLPSHICYPLLWHSQYDLLTTQIWLLPRNQEVDVLGLHVAHTSAESTDLQLEKQWDEKSFDEIMVKKIGLTYLLTVLRRHGVFGHCSTELYLNLTIDQTFCISQHEHI